MKKYLHCSIIIVMLEHLNNFTKTGTIYCKVKRLHYSFRQCKYLQFLSEDWYIFLYNQLKYHLL